MQRHSAWSGSYKNLRDKLSNYHPMEGKRLAALAALAGGLLAGAACAPSATGQSVASVKAPLADRPAPSARAARLARDLADAEMAHDLGEKARLGELVGALYASGIGPRSEEQADVLAQWAAFSGGEAAAYRGRLLGPAYVRGELAPGQRWKSAQTFKSGEPSTLAVSHKGSGPVSISVSDQRSRSVCAVGREATPACRFTPLYTQRYSIELVNEGPERAVYFLVFD